MRFSKLTTRRARSVLWSRTTPTTSFGSGRTNSNFFSIVSGDGETSALRVEHHPRSPKPGWLREGGTSRPGPGLLRQSSPLHGTRSSGRLLQLILYTNFPSYTPRKITATIFLPLIHQISIIQSTKRNSNLSSHLIHPAFHHTYRSPSLPSSTKRKKEKKNLHLHLRRTSAEGGNG